MESTKLLAIPSLFIAALIAPTRGADLYSIGDPSPEEQWYVELVNRARANPSAEGARLRDTTDPDILAAYQYFGVDTGMMYLQFQLLPPTPPLSINPRLLASARLHSQDMADHNYQGHTGSDGSTLGDRVSAQGYSWFGLAENVYSYSKSVPFGHAAFEVDWGGGLGGMQTPPGHRLNIHDATYREIGVGVVTSSSQSVGPQLVTEDFGAPQSVSPFITGVVYADRNGSGAYEAGEGLGGVIVTVSGASYYAVTASAGGYSIPVPGNGTYTVTFSGAGAASTPLSVTVVGLQNAKQDYVVTGNAGGGIRITSLHPSGISTELDFQVLNGNQSVFTIETTSSVQGPWSAVVGALIVPVSGGNYRAIIPLTVSPVAFYRVRAG